MLLRLNRGEKGGNWERILIQTGVMDGSYQGWGGAHSGLHRLWALCIYDLRKTMVVGIPDLFT